MPHFGILSFQVFTLFFVPFRPSKWQRRLGQPEKCAILSKTIAMSSAVFSLIATCVVGLGCSEASKPTKVLSAEMEAQSASASRSSQASSKPETSRVRPPVSSVKAVAAPKRVNKLTRHSGRVDGPIEYIVVEPPHAKPDTPIVVALHGWGDTPERFARLAEELDLPVRTIVARGRLAGTRRGRAWLPRGNVKGEDLEAAVGDLATLVDQLADRYPGAPKPLLYGFSQGGMLALELLASKPSCCSGVGALSARFVRQADIPVLSGAVPVLLSAGSQDAVVKPEESMQAKRRLEKAGHKAEMLTFPGRHSVPDSVRNRLRDFISDTFSLGAKKKPAQQ